MSAEQWRPLPNDPDAAVVRDMFDARSEDWLLTTQGEYHTAAAETMLGDGSGYQRVVVLEWPARRNHTDEQLTVRLMISPEDAVGLAEVLAHTAAWMQRVGA